MKNITFYSTKLFFTIFRKFLFVKENIAKFLKFLISIFYFYFLQVALAMLKVTKKDLLNQDFEGLMKYFRVNIPKTYRNEENAKQLLRVAIGIKLKRLSKYEKVHKYILISRIFFIDNVLILFAIF